jgi:predicted PurR-regulated permease PerM
MDSPRPLFPPSDATSASRLLTLVGIVVVIAGLYFGRQVLIPLALAVVIAFLLTPIVEVLERCHLGRVPSVGVVLIVSFALAAAMGWGAANRLMDIMVHLPDYRANIHNKIEAVRAPASSGLGKATTTVNDLSRELATASTAAGATKVGKNAGKEPIAVQVATPPRNAAQYLRDVIGP